MHPSGAAAPDDDDVTRLVISPRGPDTGTPEAEPESEPGPMMLSDPDSPVFWNDATFGPDQVLANSYVVRTLISRGGMGEIYRAMHRDLGTEHAVKILRPEMLAEPSAVALLLDEARLLLHIRHDGIVPCHGLIRDHDDRLLLVLEYLPGSTLAVRMCQAPIRETALLVLLRRMLTILVALEQYGVVHQDLSPDNIILRNDSTHEAMLIDFGVARILHEIDGAHQQIDFAGKYSWTSPEHLDPAKEHLIGPASDLYGLGLVMAAAALGRKLDMGNDLESAIAARSRTPPLDGIPPALSRYLGQMLLPEPRRRPTAASMIRLLDQKTLGQRIRGAMPGWRQRGPRA